MTKIQVIKVIRKQNYQTTPCDGNNLHSRVDNKSSRLFHHHLVYRKPHSLQVYYIKNT